MSNSTECPNCQQTLFGQYCAHCGQNQKSTDRYFLTLFNEAFEGIFSLDSKAWKTTLYLWFKPGFLTLEHFANRRARYISPLRLYLITSIGFFLTLSILNLLRNDVAFEVNNQDQPIPTELSDEIRQDILQGQADKDQLDRTLRDIANDRLRNNASDDLTTESDQVDNVIADTTSIESPQDIDSTSQATPATEQPKSDLSKLSEVTELTLNLPFISAEQRKEVNAKLLSKIKNAIEIAKQSPKRIIAKVIDTAPPVVFVLLPFFALVLKLFYLTSKRYYAEHVILALHNHAFLFAAMTVVTISPLILPEGISELLSVGMWIWICLYMLLSLKRVFQQSWPVTILKGTLLVTVYAGLMLFGFLAVTLIGVMLL